MEVGKRYRLQRGVVQGECLAVDGNECWMKINGVRSTFFVEGWTEIREPREFWVISDGGKFRAYMTQQEYPDGTVIPNQIRVREVLPESE